MSQSNSINTVHIRLDPENFDDTQLLPAAEAIRRGGLVIFPTETVYGIGGDATNASSAEKIYAAKGRPSDNPLIVHISDRESLKDIAKEVPQKAVKLMDAFWPGPMTLIFKKTDKVPY